MGLAARELVARDLQAIVAGNRHAAETLVPVLYAELRKLAGTMLRGLPPGQTLQATALVHEAFLKLVGSDDPGWKGRAHFFGAAARAMREILVDEARRKATSKRGADWHRVTLNERIPDSHAPQVEVLDLHRALNRLEEDDPRKGQVVMLRYFAGLTAEEIATVLDLSVATVERDWRFARVWLYSEVAGGADDA